MKAARESPLVPRGHAGERLNLRGRDSLGDQLGQHDSQTPQAAFLPGPHHPRNGARIEKRGACAGKGDSPAGTFQAAGHRPGGRRAATLADGAAQSRQALAAALAELAPGLAAGGAAQGK